MMGIPKPAMKDAAAAPTVLQAALRYASQGLSVIPVREKRCSLANWKERQERRASAAQIQYWDTAGLLQGVAVVCGRVSNNLVVMDCDGEDAVQAFVARFPELEDTYTVTSGSGRGAHFYFYAETLPPTTRVTGARIGNVELRADGCYVVAPPSIHPSGKPYNVARPVPVMRVYHLRDVVNWVKLLMQEKHGGKLPEPRGKAAPVRNDSWYGVAALNDECRKVATAGPGERNNTLNRAAFKLGRLVYRGQLSRDVVERALLAAASALADDDGDASVMRTIKSGLDAGSDPAKMRG